MNKPYRIISQLQSIKEVEDMLNEPTCDLCNAPLSVESELQNCICLNCIIDSETQAKLSCFDELRSASIGILHIAPVIEAELCTQQANVWYKAVERLHHALEHANCF